MRSVRLCLLMFLTSVSASAAEVPILMKDLPAAVQATVKAETAGATIKGISKETENGVLVYEVETTMNGLSRDLLIDKSGTVVEVEEQIAVTAAPAPVQQALSQIGELRKLERVTAHGVTTYEAHVLQASKKRSVTVDASGKVIAPK